MAKKEGWQKGVGPYSGTDDIKLRQVPQTPFAKGSEDISKVVDANSEASGGFPAPLTPERK